MRTREQLNAEYNRLTSPSVRARNKKYGYGATISLLVLYIGMFFNGYVSLAGFLGMLFFMVICSYEDEKLRQLKEEWNANGYGLVKYPLKRR